MSIKHAVILLTTLGILAGGASGSAVNSIVVYGDSLSDNGNLYSIAGQPGPPYYMGRLSNGPVAVEQVATDLGATLHDFAYAGATTGIGNSADNGSATGFGFANLPGMLTAYNATKSLLTPYLGSLFIVWGGADDFLDPSPLDTTPAATASRAISDILTIVAGLRAQGVSNILVPGMPNLGLTPEFEAEGAAAAAQATALTNAFNAALQNALLPYGVTYFDTSALLESIVAAPASYGLTDVTDPCFNGISVCSNPSQYLFFDSLHPTTAADAILSEDFIAATDSTSVPEPTTLLLAGALLLAAMGARFRKSAAE
jgi:phospholipase/lecithinase/hemolysin